MTTSPPSSAGPAAPAEPPRSLGRRLAWFAGLWTAGVAAVGAVSLLIRWWLG
jgi:hypothetical protein